MSGLRLAPDLTLPVAVVTEPVGIFANRGKGKSNAAHLLVEQLYHAGLPAIVLDIKGDWVGIRSSRDGRGAGLPFLILGGEHGDVPLEDGSGRAVAQLLSEQRVPTVVDLSGFSKTKARQWVMEFAETLYRINREPLMLVVDEADVLIPQRLSAEMMRLLGAMEDIAKRGRQRGLGICVISQRVADVNKSVTDLLETLLLFAVTGVRTRKALLEWIDDHADPQQAKDVIATLSTLPPGECWVWSPGWLHVLQRVRLKRIETFDSHATPEPGKTRTTPRTFADVDLAVIKEAMAETIERAKADDPKELRKRITELERQLRERPTETVTVTQEVRVVPGELIAVVNKARRALLESADRLVATSADLEAAEQRANAMNEQTPVTGRSRDVEAGERRTRPEGRPVRTAPAAPSRATEMPRGGSSRPAGDGTTIGKGEKVILTAVAQYPGGVTPEQLSVLTGYKRSSRNTYLQRLKQAGCVVIDAGRIIVTDTGIATLGDDFEPLPTGAALREHWLTTLPAGEARILAELIHAYPASVMGDELSERTGYLRSSRNTYLQRLRSRQLVTTIDGAPRAADVLFESA